MSGNVPPYDDLIMDHIKNARNYVVLDDANRKACGTNPLCGDEITVFLRTEHDRIEKIAFQCVCCGISMASASVMTDLIKGKDMAHARAVLREFKDMLYGRSDSDYRDASQEQLAIIETIRKFPSRERCAVLPWSTLEAALDDPQQPMCVR